MLSLRRKCRERLARWNFRFVATGSGDGDSKGKKKDGAIDLSALFKSVSKPAEKKEPIDFSKLFETKGGKSQFKLDLNPSKKEGNVDGEKLRTDLTKLFGESSARTQPGEGGLKGFKLDLSKIKSRVDGGAGGGLPPKDDAIRRERDQLSMQRMNILSKFADVTGPSLKPIPPKDHLLEKYLSLENMSAPEIQKLELQKIRREFQLHEADCGSSGVQVAALTKRMSFLAKHLTMHKKDVPSRRSMNKMVQRRRKLLIYLRRTDWEMYCHVLSRLSIKDRLEVSNKARQAGAKKKERKKRKKGKKKNNKYKLKPNDL